MGLDMYLEAKFTSPGGYEHTAQEEKDAYDKLLSTLGIAREDLPSPGMAEVSFNCCYWRKANAIHKWFVDNIQDGVDECQNAYCPRESLIALRTLCEHLLVKKDEAEAHELLPSASGFFFGSTDYGQYYWDDVEDTVKQLDKILDNPKLARAEFAYQSSW